MDSYSDIFLRNNDERGMLKIQLKTLLHGDMHLSYSRQLKRHLDSFN